MIAKQLNEHKIGIIFILLNFIGGIGTTRPEFASLMSILTPYNLLSMLIMLLYFHSPKDRNALIVAIMIFILGFGVEVMGVVTGKIFGTYHYGSSLGIKILGVPLVMGINWVVLTYIFGAFASFCFNNYVFKILTASIGLVLLDLIIEPLSGRLDFWYWNNNQIPFQNFVAWFLISLIMQFIIHHFVKGFRHKISIYLILGQVVYFGCIYVF